MPDRSTILAWTAAILILGALATSYLIWVHRTRAGYHARSLSASSRPAGALPDKTQTLHVDRCDKEFLVKIGELVEPRAIPGAPISTFEQLYGAPIKQKKAAPLTWETYPFTLTESSPGAEPPSLDMTINPGHVIQTLDDVELGIDSFAALFRKARDRNIEIHERIRRNPEPIPGFTGPSWTLTVSFASSCSARFRSEYSRTLASTQELDDQINPIPPKAGDPIPVQQPPYRSSVFMNKMISDYTMVLSNGQIDSNIGSYSEHQ